MQVLSKWFPDPVKCSYCWTTFGFSIEDLKALISMPKNHIFAVECPECSNEIELTTQGLPAFWMDYAIERENK